MAGDKGTVCVTGGTGYIGSWLIMRLLDQGYHVRTTVRSDPGKPHLCQGYLALALALALSISSWYTHKIKMILEGILFNFRNFISLWFWSLSVSLQTRSM